MKTTNILLTIPFLLLSAIGCTSDEQVGEPVTNEKGEYPVNFSGSMDMTLTKAEEENTSKLDNGVKATIYAYANGATVTGESSAAAAITSGNYTADGSGNFSGTNYTMYLAKGSYDFYVVSCNSTSTDAPQFTNGTSAELSNGVDYIWGNATGQSIPNTGNSALNTENKNSVSLGLAHKAVCIEITVKTAANTGIELISWESTAANDNATIMPPANSNCKMSLSNGNIEPATSVVTAGTTASNMTTTGVTGTSGYGNEKTATASYYMLPLAAASGGSSSQDLTVTFKVKVKIEGHTYTDENGESKTYTANLKAPESASYAFAGGSKYSYTATLKPNTISFTGATVTNWTAVTVDNDLEPTEPDASGGSN